MSCACSAVILSDSFGLIKHAHMQQSRSFLDSDPDVDHVEHAIGAACEVSIHFDGSEHMQPPTSAGLSWQASYAGMHQALYEQL